MNVQSSIPAQWWERIRWTKYGFLAGLMLGVLLGWFFHGVISLAIRFGLVLLLLLPLMVIGWLWMRSTRRQSTVSGEGGAQVVTWSSGKIPPTGPFTGTTITAREYPRPDSSPGPTFTDVPFTPSERAQRTEPGAPRETTPEPTQPRRVTLPDDVEAELRALKRQQESSR